MKTSFALLLVLFSFTAFAQDIYLPDYHYTVTDVARRGLSKEQVFAGLNRSFLRLDNSICSNRALVWAHDMKHRMNLDTAKIFLFYTEKTGEASDKTWWYHVAPMVNENGQLWVVDAGFRRFVPRPMTAREWLKKFAGSENCKELTTDDEDLVERMFRASRFPSRTRHGTFDCYYRIASAPFWTPSTVARHMLGRDRDGRVGDFSRSQIHTGELMTACMEATTTPLNRAFSNARRRCLSYLGL